MAIKTEFVEKEGKLKGSKVVFHIHSVWGKCLNKFLGKHADNLSEEEIVAFQAGSEFLVCKRQEENIEGYNVLNVYLREIQTGLTKDVILWLNDNNFEQGIFHDESNQVG